MSLRKAARQRSYGPSSQSDETRKPGPSRGFSVWTSSAPRKLRACASVICRTGQRSRRRFRRSPRSTSKTRTSPRWASATRSSTASRRTSSRCSSPSATKFEPQTLVVESTRPIPETLTANGIRFSTDIVERRFAPEPTAVDAPPKTDRKRRLDVLVPGVSIGQERVDRRDARVPRPRGRHGRDADAVELARVPGRERRARRPDRAARPVRRQPRGRERVRAARAQLPRAGRGLRDRQPRGPRCRRRRSSSSTCRCGGSATRSSATASSSPAAPPPSRTASSRVCTRSRGSPTAEGITEQIGGFEIGPDAEQPAADGEISMGGDSGSAWMALDDRGRTDRHDARPALRRRGRRRRRRARARLLRIVGLRASSRSAAPRARTARDRRRSRPSAAATTRTSCPATSCRFRSRTRDDGGRLRAAARKARAWSATTRTSRSR